jgi:integrase
MQSAAALELLINWPVRAGNIADLDLEMHIARPPGGTAGKWKFLIESGEVKNEVNLYRELNEDSSALLEYYLRRYRTKLLGNRTCTRLFITQHGKPKSRAQLGIQLKRFVKRRLGLDFNLHLMRSLAGKIHLSEYRGHYVDVKNILGHKDINTTLGAYVGLETDQSFELYDESLERRRGTSGLRFRDHRAKTPRTKARRKDP